jgi:hypothetical protein
MTKARDLANSAAAFAAVSATELGYVDGVTSAIQTQMDAKTAKSTLTTTGDIYYASAANTPARLGIGSSAQVLTVASGVPSWATPASGSTFVGCRLFNSADQSLANATATAVTFNSETYDTDGFHSTATNTSRITIPAGKGGYYLFSAATRWPGGNSTGLRAQYLYKNGVEIWAGTFFAPTNTTVNETLIYTQIFSAVATDYFELFAYQSTGGAHDVQGGSAKTTFQATYLGA